MLVLYGTKLTGMELSKKEIAELSGYTYRWLHEIDMALPDDKKLFVKGEGGKYDLAIFMRRWVAYNVQREKAAADDLDAVKARHEVVKIEKTELEVARLRGDLIDKHDVIALWGNVISTARKNLLGIASDLAPDLVMLDSVEIIQTRIETAIMDALIDTADTPIPDGEPIPEEQDEQIAEGEETEV